MKFINKNLALIIHFLSNTNEKFKLSFIGFIVGITSSLAAVALNRGLIFLGNLHHQIEHHFLAFFLPAIGLLLTVILLKYVIKDYGGHGLPDVIHSLSLKAGIIKFRSSYSKLLGSLITISFGGSAGPEAPIVVSGAAIGSNIARLFRSNERIRIAVAGSGAAAAIASIFNAPIAGIIFTMEVIIGEWTPIYLLPLAIASVTGTEISRLLSGNQIPFDHQLFQVGLNDIIASLGLAVFCAMLSVVFIRTLRATSGVLEQYFKNHLLKALIGGLIIGVIAFQIPQVRGEGYHFVAEIIGGHYSGGLFLIFLIILFKILATSVTLGAGGAGGVFAPALLIGSAGGLLYANLIHILFPGLLIQNVQLFALVGMAGILSGTLHAPLTGIFLIVEISNGYDAILPLLLVSFVTSALVKKFEKHSIYHYELVKKGYLHRPRTDGKILAEINPVELLEKDTIVVHPEMLLKDLIPIIKKSRRNYFPVVERENGHLLGMIHFNDIKAFIFDKMMISTLLVEEMMQVDFDTVTLDNSLPEIQQKFEMSNTWSLPVVKNGVYQGLISKATMLDLYRKELKVQTEQ